jgi:hypothetical protein
MRPEPQDAVASVTAALAAVAADPEDEYSLEPIVTPCCPGRKTGHSLAFSPVAGVLMFGGVGSDQVPSNELWKIQVSTGSSVAGHVKFSRVATVGTPPAARAFHACCSHFANMIVAGGEDSCVLGDLHVLDTCSLTWSQPKLPVPMPPAKALQMSLVGDHLIVFGGEDRAYQPCNTATMFHVGHSQKAPFAVSSPLLSLTGEPPFPRHSHAGSGLGGLVVWGGQGDHFYGDLWLAVEDAEEKRASAKRHVFSLPFSHACFFITVFSCLFFHYRSSHACLQARETAEEVQR